MATKKTKNQKKTEPEKKLAEVSHVPLEMPSLYINNAQISFSIFDAAIIVGELQSGDEEANTMNIHPHAKLVMSHRFLVEFANLINRNLRHLSEDKDLNPDGDIKSRVLDKGGK